ncbi:MAG: tRNA uridine(34) 5-carboxymethylaminomethyl modification radical SAM/GNAT enzyme Elp3 [Nitrososphaerota archaeon]|nr:tRNA uridine(34) 5-carboxymethylaminomethyl modification radical SAM/GNAT enzyme Elp3 [Nitrososphaerota archaeon]
MLSERAIWQIKLDVCKEFGLDRVPKNSEILEYLDPEERSEFESRLRRKNIRTSSGIAVITAITKPFNCPHGTCTFCPGGVRYGTPQSYTKNSPAASFGIARNFDPNQQVRDMIDFLHDNGHSTSKIEMILLGGTILAMPKEYQRDFVKSCFDSLNECVSTSLNDAIKKNENASHRCVGLTIETKPDWCRSEHIDTLLSYATTRVELGVQSLREDVLKEVNRGHTLEDTKRAFQLSKDSSFKVVAHMMPGLPKSDPDRDLEDLLSLVEDDQYKPDMLKIYPTLVVEGTALYQQFKMGLFKPYDLEQLKNILSKFKSRVPPWVRIMRIQREIPKEEIVEGNRAGNLRQIVLDEMGRKGLKCRCIRCREVGHKRKSNELSLRLPELKRIDFNANGGQEIFISYEDEFTDTLHGFLRLRIPSGEEHRPEIKSQRCALVRELHVYGTVVPVGEKGKPETSQHKGMGSRLLNEAERISKEYSRKKIVVISAVGTREYYRKRGYYDDGPYVSKTF